MICRNCGDEYPDYKDYCPSCGTRNPEVSYNAQYSSPQSANRGGNAQYYANPQNGRYQQPQNTVYVRNNEPHYDEHVSIGGWIGRWILMCIPIVNVVMLFVWSFGGTRKYSLKTWARARLLLALIIIAVLAISIGVLLAMGVNFNDIYNTIVYGYVR